MSPAMAGEHAGNLAECRVLSPRYPSYQGESWASVGEVFRDGAWLSPGWPAGPEPGAGPR
jgi:hypothetical protein